MADRRSWVKEAMEGLAERFSLGGRRPSRGDQGALRLYVRLARPGLPPLTIGCLSQDGREFVFQYDPRFAKSPSIPLLPDFPEASRSYRSDTLWPFFEARIPPVDRTDIQQLIREGELDSGDYLRLLALVSRQAASSPYLLELEDLAPREAVGPTRAG